MEVTEKRIADILIINIQGRIDSFCAQILQDELQTIINTGCFKTVLNLEKTTFLSASCLRVFLKANTRSSKLGGKICLSHLSEAVTKLVNFTKADRVIDIYENVDMAVASFDGGEAKSL